MRALRNPGTADLVIPYTDGLRGPFAFRTARTHTVVGARAVVVDVPDLTCAGLARLELGLVTSEPLGDVGDHLAAVLLLDLAWLQEVPEGSEVRISRGGTMTVHPNAGPEWWRFQARAWARKQRRQGYLPVLVLARGRWRPIALPWPGAPAMVSLETLRARLEELPRLGRALEAFELL